MSRDVRMRGFSNRADVVDVLAFLAERSSILEDETVPLLECIGRVITNDIYSEVSVPGFIRSAMDGFAVCGEETFGASSYAPLVLHVIGESMPGNPFEGSIQPGEAVRIMTGAPLPAGADAVAQAEICQEKDGQLEILDAVAPRKNVGEVGEDIRAGELLLSTGRRIRPQDAAVLSSVGRKEIACVRRPRVELIITGDELMPPGSIPSGARITDSNSVMLRGLLARDGGLILPYELLSDHPSTISEALSKSEGDIILISGGSSVGREDHAPRILADIGTLDFHGVAMRPSSPAGVGRLLSSAGKERFVFLLPGNPVSCLCAYEFFAGPTIRALGGRSREWPHKRLTLPLLRKITSAIGRLDYVRVAIENDKVVPLATSGASILSSTVRASGCVLVGSECEGMPEGEMVEVFLYDEDARVDS